METFLLILAGAGGYVASIYTWPWIRTHVAGAEAEIARLKVRLDAIRAAL